MSNQYCTILVRKIILTLVLAIAAPHAVPLELDGMRYGNFAARSTLRTPISAHPRFFRVVGGVAFGAVAEPEAGWRLERIAYDPSVEDGQRLKVALVNSQRKVKTVSAKVFDWQLGPIASFVSDDSGQSAVTLFGTLADPDEDARVKSHDNKVINYHPAFDDTLLGLRLLQADMLLIDRRAADIFREQNVYILGKGEVAPSQQQILQNRRNWDSVDSWVTERAAEGITYHSYVVGDLQQKITFYPDEDLLKFRGDPTWLAWTNPPGHYESAERSAKQDLLSRLKAKRIDTGVVYLVNQSLARVREYEDRAKAITDLPSDQVQSALSDLKGKEIETLVSDVRELFHVHPKKNSSKLLDRDFRKMLADQPGTSERLGETLLALAAKADAPTKTAARRLEQDYRPENSMNQLPVQTLPEFSEQLSEQIRVHNGINPIIYESVVTTMHISALLRHYKAKKRPMFKQFLIAVQAIPINPVQPVHYKVNTPSVYPHGRDTRRQ